MWTYFFKKLAIVSLTLLGATFLAFAMIRLVPGDPVTHLLGDRGGSPEQVAQMRANLGLDRSWLEQYGLFVAKAITGDLGYSVVSQRPVSEEFFDRFPATLELGLVALLWASLLGLPMGVWAAYRQKTFFDYGTMGLSLIGYSMPLFWWGLLLILFFSVGLGWFPVSGRMDLMFDVPPVSGFLLYDVWWTPEASFLEKAQAFQAACRHLFLPAIVLGTIPLALIARITRACVIESLSKDYVRAARSRGLSEVQVLWNYALRNSWGPIVTVLGLLVGSIMTGAVLTETLFSWPGVGRWLVKSIEARDYPVIQGGILYTSFAVVLVNLSTDIIVMFLNPKSKQV